jgi:hypothetical protein
MAITIDAVVENGLRNLRQPVPDVCGACIIAREEKASRCRCSIVEAQLVFGAQITYDFKVTVACCDCKLHLFRQRGDHHIHLRQHAAALSQVLKYLTVLPRKVLVERSYADTRQQSVQSFWNFSPRGPDGRAACSSQSTGIRVPTRMPKRYT